MSIITDKSKELIEINNIAYGGDGIGNLGSGKTVFVSRTIPGEIHLVEKTIEKKSYAYGESKNIIKSSDDRTDAKCEIFDKCGGCQWQHINYEKQKKLKEDILRDSLARIGKLENINIEPILEVDYPWYYRNKSTIPFQKNENNEIIAGFYKRGTHEVIDNHKCYIQHQLINRIKRYTVDLLNKYERISVYDEKRHSGLLRHLHIRVGVCTNHALLTFITTKEEFPHLEEIANNLMKEIPELKGIVRNINNKKSNILLGNKGYTIIGQDYITDFIGERKFKISYDSFFQVNTIQTEKLYNIIENYLELDGNQIIVDAYSGIGSITIYIKENYKEIYGIENNLRAIKDSENNAKLNNLNKYKFIHGDVKNILPGFIKKGNKPDIMIFDPPRSGIEKDILETVIASNINEIIYVSCNPTTLARDLKILKNYYKIIKIQPVDMFPQTYHLETVCKLKLI